MKNNRPVGQMFDMRALLDPSRNGKTAFHFQSQSARPELSIARQTLALDHHALTCHVSARHVVILLRSYFDQCLATHLSIIIVDVEQTRLVDISFGELES